MTTDPIPIPHGSRCTRCLDPITDLDAYFASDFLCPNCTGETDQSTTREGNGR